MSSTNAPAAAPAAAAARPNDSWLHRLTQLVGTTATGASFYETGMRRSIQTIILYEAKRIVDPLRSALKTYQRKAAFLDQANALVESCTWITNKDEILWRTGTSKEPLNEEIAWKRVRLIEKELEKMQASMVEIAKEHPDCSNHEELCNRLTQHLYEQNPTNRGRPVPRRWEHANNHLVMAYRLYYKGAELDQSFPKPNPPRPVQAPATVVAPTTPTTNNTATPAAASTNATSTPASSPTPRRRSTTPEQSSEQRLAVLLEVKEHLEVLKCFVGVVSDAEIATRKRQLFEALPPAPKKQRN